MLRLSSLLARPSSCPARTVQQTRAPLDGFRRWLATRPGSSIEVLGKEYLRDDYTNVTPAILSKLGADIYTRPGHPLCTLRSAIEAHFHDFSSLAGTGAGASAGLNLDLSPLVYPHANFDELSFPLDHPGRARTDSYYVNRNAMLRTHTSAHEVAVFGAGLKRWLLAADVFRRDEVDARHYPVFHQMEGARLWPHSTGIAPDLQAEDEALRARLKEVGGAVDESALEGLHADGSVINPYQGTHDPKLAALVARHLRSTISLLLVALFARAAGATREEPLQIRWVSAYFPFTTPSYEAEVFFRGRWLEVLGCGVIQQATLTHAGVQDEIGWAFGLGLERIAMVLFGIPDIRLFWSNDSRFLNQFKAGEISAFKPYSKYPSSARDVSFWRTPEFHSNDFADIVRGVAGDLVEEVELIDEFTHPKSQRQSVCFRVNYRSMDRSLEGSEVNHLNDLIKRRAVEELGAEIR